MDRDEFRKTLDERVSAAIHVALEAMPVGESFNLYTLWLNTAARLFEEQIADERRMRETAEQACRESVERVKR